MPYEDYELAQAMDAGEARADLKDDDLEDLFPDEDVEEDLLEEVEEDEEEELDEEEEDED